MRESNCPNRRERVLIFLVLLPMVRLANSVEKLSTFYNTNMREWRNWQTRPA